MSQTLDPEQLPHHGQIQEITIDATGVDYTMPAIVDNQDLMVPQSGLHRKKIVNKKTHRDRGDCAVVTYHRTEDDAPPMVHR